MKIWILSLVAGLAISVSASGVSAKTPSTAMGNAQTTVEIPSTGQNADGLAGSDPQASAADASQSAWQAYQAAVKEALIDSDRPRDWALAANMQLFFEGSDSANASRPGREQLLDRAAHRAPDDVLVQWITTLDHCCANNYVVVTAMDDSVDALTRLEPDNAAAWMMALTIASKRKDAVFVDEALAHMASSRRYDDHFTDTLHAWLDVYDRYPMPSALLTSDHGLGTVPTTTSNAALQSIADFTSAMAQAAATAMPAYQFLITACKPGKGDGGSWQRYAYCEDAGRLMLGKGRSLLARAIGFAILRNLGAATAADREERRNFDWYSSMSLEASGYGRNDEEVIEGYQADWRRLDDEIEVFKRALRRAGLPDTAPAGWSGSSWTASKTPPG